MRVLGIDPSLVATGWGVVEVAEDQSVTLVQHGVIKPPVKAPMAQRLLTLFEGLEVVLEQFYPDAVAMEWSYVNGNGATSLKLGLVRGALMVALAKRGFAIHEYAPCTVKLVLCGHGNSLKSAVSASVVSQLSIAEPLSLDASDALAVALCFVRKTLNL